jgi:homoserine dehydrogenase
MGEGVRGRPYDGRMPSPADAPEVLRVGVLGCGNVGGPLVELIAAQGDAIEARTGVRLVVTRVAVRDLTKPRAHRRRRPRP